MWWSISVLGLINPISWINFYLYILKKETKMLNDFNEKIASHQQFTQSLRKITDEATNRMFTRTAKGQYEEAMETLKQNSIPESDNYFVTAKHLA